jgi:hypothetical protein
LSGSAVNREAEPVRVHKKAFFHLRNRYLTRRFYVGE